MFSPNSTPGQWIGGHHRIRAGLQIQIFWEIEFGLYAPGVGHPGREAGPVFPAQTARRLRALPSASLAPILSGWKQTSGGAIRVPLLCVVHPGQDADGAIGQAKANKLAALRENGEAREIYLSVPP